MLNVGDLNLVINLSKVSQSLLKIASQISQSLLTIGYLNENSSSNKFKSLTKSICK